MKRILLSILTVSLALSYNAGAKTHKKHDLYSDNRNSKDSKGTLIHRMSLGGGLYFNHQSFEFTYTRPVDGKKFTAQRNGIVKQGVTGSLDFSIPISRISTASNVSLNIGLNAAMATFTHDTVVFGGTGSNLIYAKERKLMVGGLPISIDFKTGGEAICCKARKALLTLGVGVQPSMIQLKEEGQDEIGYNPPGKIKVNDPSASYSRIRMASFAKAEIGFVAGMAFKIRYVAYFGEMGMIKESVKDSDFKVSASGTFGSTLSLIIMPGSIGWKN